MVSTPGPGLAHVDFNEVWRDSIAQISLQESNAASQIINLRTLIDASTLSFEPDEIWPVIVAAGKGTRAAETGLKTPKPIALVRDTACHSSCFAEHSRWFG